MSIALLATDTTVICRVIKALYDAAPGYTYLSNFLSYKEANGLSATVNGLTAAFSSSSNAELAATVCTNIGLDGAAYTAGVDYLTAQFNARPTARGDVIADAMAALTGLSGDATFGSYADTFNSAVAVSEAYSTNSSNTSTNLAVLQAADDTATVGSTFTLTEDTNSFTGTAADDTFNGVITASATVDTGDVIDGGAGIDTLSILGNASGQAVSIQLDNVENVTVRLVGNTDVDASLWTGVSTLAVTGNIEDVSLEASAVNIATTIDVSNENDVYVQFADVSASADTANLILRSYGESAADRNTIDLDWNDGGALEGANVELHGANYINLELGVSATAITLTGDGSITLQTDDTLSTVNAAALTGSNKFTFTGTSNVTLTGGAGNDTAAFMATYSDNDHFDGGAGTDTLQVVITNASRDFGNVSNVETLKAGFSGTVATMSLSATSFTNVQLESGSGTTVTINQAQTGTTIFLTDKDDGVGDINLDYVTGAGTAEVYFGTTAGNVDIGDLSVTDAAMLKIATTGGLYAGTGTQTMSAITLDNDVQTLAITANGSASLTMQSAGMVGTAIESVTITAAGSASFAADEGVFDAASSIASISLNAYGDDGNTLRFGSGMVGSATPFSSQSFALAVSAADGAEIYFEGVKGKSSSYSVEINVGQDSEVGNYSATNGLGSGIHFTDTAAGMMEFVLNVGASASAAIDDIDMASASGSISQFDVTVAAKGDADIQDLIAKTIGNISISGAGSATVQDIEATTIGDLDVNLTGGVTIARVGTATTSVGNITLAGSSTTLTEVAATTVGEITITNSGTVSVTVSATTVGTIDFSGANQDGTVRIDIADVTNGTTILAGAGTNTITSGEGSDDITLKAASGTDTIRFETGSEGDGITNFQLATSTDKIQFGSGFDLDIWASGTAFASGAASMRFYSATADIGSGDQVIVLRTGTYDSAGSALSAIATGGTLALSGGEATSAGTHLVVMYSDGTDSYVATVSLGSAVASGGGFVEADDTITIMATLYGVDVASSTTLGTELVNFNGAAW